MGEEKERVNSLLRRVWSHRKRREVMEILSHFDPSNEKRCYLGGFLRYGVKLSVDEILDICDIYAKWNDYDREKTAYHLKHIEHRSKKTPRNDERSESLRFTCSENLPEDATRMIGIEDSGGFVMSWIRVEYKLG